MILLMIHTLRHVQRTVKETAVKLARRVHLVLRRVLPDRRSGIRRVACRKVIDAFTEYYHQFD